MKTWWNLPLAISLAVIPVMSAATQRENGYSVDEVTALLKQPSGFSSSFSEKQVSRLGDRVSIALMKIYSEKDLRNPQNIKRYLPLIIDAFRFPKLVSPDDREPRITLILLKFLDSQVNDKSLHAEILKARQLVIEEAASSQ